MWRFGFNCYFSIRVHKDRGDVHLERELRLQLLIFFFLLLPLFFLTTLSPTQILIISEHHIPLIPLTTLTFQRHKSV